MSKLFVLSALVGVLLLPGLCPGQEKTVVLCDEGDPQTECPGERCLCVDDTIEVVFDGKTDPASDSIYEYDEFVAGTEMNVSVIQRF